MIKNNTLYEVKCTIKDNDYQGVFEKYMTEKHIPDILRTNCFTDIYFVQEEDKTTYKISYLANAQESLDKYLKEFAPALRDDFVKNIDTHMVQVSRRFANCVSFSQNAVCH